MSFPRYPEYKDSGQDWLGTIPSHWRVIPLAKIALGPGSLFIDGDWVESKDLSDEGIRYITTGNVGEGRYKEQGSGYISQAKFDELRCTEVLPGDVLISRLNLPIGRACVVPDLGGRIITSVDNVITRPDSGYSRSYLAYMLSCASHFANMEILARGTTMQRISRSTLGQVRFAFPPTEEQTAIATFLDRETAKIDALVAEQEKLIALLREKRQAVISHAVTKGLDPNVPMKDSGVEWLGEVPGHWEVSQLRYVVREGTSITYGIVQAGPEVEDGVPYIRTSDMSGNALPLTGYPKTSLEIDASYARSKVNAGDLVISIRASVGKCLPVPPELDGANLTQGTAKIAPGGKAPAAFMLPFISSEPIQLYLDSKAKGATFKEITLETLRKTPFLVPPLEEQLRIAKWVSDQDQQFQALIDAAEQAQKLLRERRTALISAAVTGQIDVRGMFSKEVNA